MAVPKRKVSAARRDKRRTATERLSAPELTTCKKCGEPVLAHRVCKACGTYDGKTVIEIDDGKSKKND